MSFLKQGPTQTTSTTSSLPPHIQQGQEYLMGIAQMLTAPQFAMGAPEYGVMGLTPDQSLASDLANQAAVFTGSNLAYPNPLGGPSIAASQAAVNPFSASAQQASAEKATAQQLAPGEISPFMNPYIDTALNPVLERLKKQQAEVQSGIGAQSAASHMYGGSREAVMRMLADRNYRDTLGTTAGNMLHAGWQVASGLASQNADRRQQTALTNAQMANQIAALNAQLGTQAGLANAQLGQQASIANAQLGTQASIAEANRYLTALGLQGQLNTQNLNNQLNTAAMLNMLGGQQRQIGQQSLDLPFTRLQQLLSVTPMAVPQSSTSTTTQQKPLDIGSIISGGLGLLGAFSDRRLKENIERIGRLPNGLPIYSFNFIGSGVSQVGLMSDDVRRIRPQAVHVVDGYDWVDYGLAVR
jgi:hypothetical protein